MRIAPWIVVLATWISLTCPNLQAHPIRTRISYPLISGRLHGQLLPFTKGPDGDNRIWSQALCEKRDMYVYLPPHFDPELQYPLLIWLHGFAQDEYSFLVDVVELFDEAITRGQIPPMIIAAPDGSPEGNSCFFQVGTFFLNTKLGAFEDYLLNDVWNFLMQNFPIRPEREAHVLGGVSMGGGVAYNKAFKCPERFKVVFGIFPPLNVRWMDTRGRYRANFHPDDWGWKTDFASRPREVVGRFYGLIPIRQRNVILPLYGRIDPSLADKASRDNPIEMLDSRNVQDGQFAMYIAYGGLDEFNIDAQVESFLHRAGQRGLTIKVDYDRFGRHSRTTASKFVPSLLCWLNEQLVGYGPCRAAGPCNPGIPVR